MALIRVPCLTNCHIQPDLPVTQELVPSLFAESITGSSSKSVQPFFWYNFTKSFLHKKFYLAVFFLFFSSYTFYGLVGACMNSHFVATFTCLSNNSLISSWISTKFYQHFFHVHMPYLSHYFQPEVNT